MARVDELLSDYAAYHTTRGNIACHFVGIPLIMYGILALLLLLPIFQTGFGTVTAAEIVVLLAVIYYCTLDLRFAVSMLLAAALFDVLARISNDARISLAAFVIGWAFQSIGHAVYEKRSPAFMRNLVHLLVGPIFLINEASHFRSVADGSLAKTQSREV
jgi:uncharacterized membrane protein YGL010W